MTAHDAAAHRPLVEVDSLSVSFRGPAGTVRAVEDISFAVHPGECVAIVGESGSGKSVTARSLVGLNGREAVPEAAALRVDGRDALGFSQRDWRAVRGPFAGLVLQDALVSLDPLRTVGQEAGEAIRHHRLEPRGRVRDRVLETLRAVGMPDPERRIDAHPHELSGGLRQRALIASAIAAKPRLIVADEPTTALDVTVQRQIVQVLADRVADGTGLLLISHDLAVVADIADRVLVMERGRVVEDGPAHQVLRRPGAPYTRRLLAAIPTAASRGARLTGDRPATGVSAPSATVRRLPPGPGGDVVLEARGLTKTYPVRGRSGTGGRQRFTALDDVSFRLHRGEALGIVGESGSGKTTCADIVLALTRPDSGEVRLHGRPWSALTERERRDSRRLVQYVPQDPLSSFDPRWTVGQVLAENIHGADSRDRRRELAATALERVGLSAEHLIRRPRSLSGGQRQRVAIARALMGEPEIIVCDEPVSALDVLIQAQVLDLIADLRAELGTSLLFISHDLGVVHHLTDRVLVFKDGRVVERGDVDEVFEAPGHPYTRELLASLPGQELRAS
ncbi:ABC transporter ATP-binding protein [Streptomyces antioxidans]|uniref:ABC transporter ATP-binding protein n=1 Tax=Streptomyces antioxidans TaxID=1507734 RepID=A0A1V4D7M8_9ACTN|nr:ABC transporter ATP-binding protein [Streptomyces antioxidans]OPF81005.1 ABC transporter ATP-binding protein [Streptomyces antioxidans]